MEQRELEEMTWSELAAFHTQAKNTLASAKSSEMAIRKYICAEVLGSKIKGVKHHVAEGFDFAATAKLNNTLDKELLESLIPDLSESEKECIVYKPSLVAKHYNTLDSQSKLHLAVTSKPGTPSLTIKPVKV